MDRVDSATPRTTSTQAPQKTESNSLPQNRRPICIPLTAANNVPATPCHTTPRPVRATPMPSPSPLIEQTTIGRPTLLRALRESGEGEQAHQCLHSSAGWPPELALARLCHALRLLLPRPKTQPVAAPAEARCTQRERRETRATNRPLQACLALAWPWRQRDQPRPTRSQTAFP